MTDYCEVKIWCDFPTVVRVIHACTGEVRYYATECETCEVEKLVEGTTPDGYQAYVWHCLSCGGKMFGGNYALYGHVPPRFCQHCGARVVGGS